MLVRADDWRYLLNPRPLEGLLHLGGSADVDTVLVGGVPRVRGGRLIDHAGEELEADYLAALESFTLRCLDVPADSVAAVMQQARSRTNQREGRL